MYVAFAAFLLVTLVSQPATAQDLKPPPDVPPAIAVPDGHRPYAVARAIGTQNYICQPTAMGPAWRLFGPQATLFQIDGASLDKQVATHFLSANPAEGGTARPTWQHSTDSSRVWGRAAADPVVVDPDAIPWLLVQVVGAVPGLHGSSKLTQTTYIQRIATVGGVADPATCSDPARIGATVLVPYQADYVFYRAHRTR